MRRTSKRLAGARLDPGATLLLLGEDPPDGRDRDAMVAFLRAGGRAIVGRGQASALAGLDGGPPTADAGGTSSFGPRAPIAEVAGLTRVETAGRWHWRRPGRFLSGLGPDDESLLLAQSVGRGRALALADLSALDNRHLGRADNAALAVRLAGPSGRAVVIFEGVGTFDEATGLSAVPRRWRWALGGLFAAVLTWMAASGRRPGPPESARRDLGPERAAHAVAIGGLLARTHDPAWSAAVLRRRARSLLGGPGEDLAPWDDERMVAEATHRGIDPADAVALLGPSGSDDDLLRSARALAHLERRNAAR